MWLCIDLNIGHCVELFDHSENMCVSDRSRMRVWLHCTVECVVCKIVTARALQHCLIRWSLLFLRCLLIVASMDSKRKADDVKSWYEWNFERYTAYTFRRLSHYVPDVTPLRLPAIPDVQDQGPDVSHVQPGDVVGAAGAANMDIDA